jgi:hypothetical protein
MMVNGFLPMFKAFAFCERHNFAPSKRSHVRWGHILLTVLEMTYTYLSAKPQGTGAVDFR